MIELLALEKHTQLYVAKTYGAKGFEKELRLKKIVLPPKSTEFILELTSELKKVVKVTHPNVCPFYDFGSVKNQYFLTYESLSGFTLDELNSLKNDERFQLTRPQSLYIATEVFKGLHAIHTRFKEPQTLSHGHIQPKNIFLSVDGEVKILNLGLDRLTLKYKINDQMNEFYSRQMGVHAKLKAVPYDLHMATLVLFEMLTGTPLLQKLPEDSGQFKISRNFLEHYFKSDLLFFFERALGLAEPFEQALEMSTALQRILYSEYTDFSSVKFFDQIRSRFSLPQKSKATSFVLAEETLKELIESSQDQINWVHREGTEYSELMGDTIGISVPTPDVFSSTQTLTHLPNNEASVKSNPNPLAQNELVIDEEESSKEAKFSWQVLTPVQKIKVGGFIFLCFVLVVTLGTLAFQTRPKTSFKNPLKSPHYQLTIESVPEGAKVWLDGKLMPMVTPATFLALEKNKSYPIVVQKEGFDDFRTVLLNDSDKDQILDVVLRKEF